MRHDTIFFVSGISVEYTKKHHISAQSFLQSAFRGRVYEAAPNSVIYLCQIKRSKDIKNTIKKKRRGGGRVSGYWYLRPNPNPILLEFIGDSLLDEGSHRSGINLSGSGYNWGSLSAALFLFSFFYDFIFRLNLGINRISRLSLVARTKYLQILLFRQGFGSPYIHRLLLLCEPLLEIKYITTRYGLYFSVRRNIFT